MIRAAWASNPDPPITVASTYRDATNSAAEAGFGVVIKPTFLKPGTHWRHVACYMYRIQATCIGYRRHVSFYMSPVECIGYMLPATCIMYRIHVADTFYK